ncbi:ECF transporter S component [Bifidobacterium sp.]|jgi:energy-coupling factor transport system substrate-specific component|uniref:ECF transporter S component n=1 Tax=Bifidobacterium sp. TaxID=41200 RepID=UPI0025BBD4D4|nr:ECF transporter S component [Bifidobacterium sp.]MCH4209497.1 ECF transporter S component [Bifidobacterium sp.]MCI1225273.1 ECF transporter S component [Bifidobacterium sp.]
MSAPSINGDHENGRHGNRIEAAVSNAQSPSPSAAGDLPGQSGQPRATAHIWHQLRRWRAIDITVASVIAVASGIVFRLVDLIVIVPYAALEGVLPGLAGLLSGFWYFAGVLTMLIVRKPGAALYAETVAACLELVLGNQWGAGGSLVAGIAQGLLTEIAFLMLAYRHWNAWAAALAGAFAAIGGLGYSFVTTYAGINVTGVFAITNILSNVVSGAVVSGALMWLLYRGVARAGALSRFESGRELTPVADVD